MTTEVRCGYCSGRCRMTVKLDNNQKFVSAAGNACSNGAKYAREEIDNPFKIFASLIAIKGGSEAVSSVKTNKPVPKELFSVIEEYIKSISLSAPVTYGDIVMTNILDTGADIIITRAVPAQAIAAYA